MGCGKSKPEPEKQVQVKNEIPEYKVIVIGDSCVGKTAIIHQYINNTFLKTITPTMGVSN